MLNRITIGICYKFSGSIFIKSTILTLCYILIYNIVVELCGYPHRSEERLDEFMAPNKFEMRTKFGSNGGTYEVKKAFIYVTYSTNNATYKIPYEFKNGELILDCATAFSIYE